MRVTVVIGLGNSSCLMMGLEYTRCAAAGVAWRRWDDVMFVDGGTLGLDLLSIASGATFLLLLDAVEVGAPPGTLARFDRGQLTKLTAGSSAHELGVSDLLAALRILDAEPEDIVLFGVQPEATTLGTRADASR